MFLVRLMAELVAPSLTLHESTQSRHIARKMLVTFAIFARFECFWTPFLAIFLSKSRILLNLLFLLFLRYFLLFQCFQVAGNILVTFEIFFKSRIMFYWLLLLLLRYLRVGVSQKIFGDLFPLRKLRREFANNIVPGHIYRNIFFPLQFFTHCLAIQYKPSNKAAGEVKHYYHLVLTDPGVLGISMTSAL